MKTKNLTQWHPPSIPQKDLMEKRLKKAVLWLQVDVGIRLRRFTGDGIYSRHRGRRDGDRFAFSMCGRAVDFVAGKRYLDCCSPAKERRSLTAFCPLVLRLVRTTGGTGRTITSRSGVVLPQTSSYQWISFLWRQEYNTCNNIVTSFNT
jgi:hypothetical protein